MTLPAQQLDERERLLDELAELIALMGYGDFLFGPIVLPNEKHFPDEWRPDLAGARLMLARLMAYARLGKIPVRFRDDSDPTWQTDDGDDFVPPHRDAAAWFAGANEFGTYLFGVRVAQLADPMQLAGILAHEAAHAWRFRRDIMDSSTAKEERLTDLSTVFLGFGVLRANISSLANDDLKRRGYLATFPLCFALGVQLALRNDDTLQREVEAALGTDQRVMVREIRDLYARDRNALIARLRLPGESEWVRPAPAHSPPPAKLAVSAKPGRDIVFRVRARPVAAFAAVSSVLGGLCALSAMAWWPLALPVFVTPLSLLVRRDRCSGAECGHVLPANIATCPSCGGRVVGRIKRVEDRDEAERAYLATSDPLANQARDLVRDLLKGSQ